MGRMPRGKMAPRLVLVTGASGFLGRQLVGVLNAIGSRTRAISRSSEPVVDETISVEWRYGDLTDTSGWSSLLNGVDTVVHLAALTDAGPEERLMEFNAKTTGLLARQASEAGVGHFVYVSSVRVYGHVGIISATTPTNPADAYGHSKLAGEKEIIAATANGSMTYAILRPPFVYGSDRSGLLSFMNFAARTGLPLPLAGLNNRRSLIFVGNLADAVATAARAAEIHGYALPVSDGFDSTYTDLFTRLAALHGRSAMTWPFPTRTFKIAARLGGRAETAKRMLENCVVSGSEFAERLNWIPPYSPDVALRLTFFGK